MSASNESTKDNPADMEHPQPTTHSDSEKSKMPERGRPSREEAR
jgi:hypothetical protein